MRIAGTGPDYFKLPSAASFLGEFLGARPFLSRMNIKQILLLIGVEVLAASNTENRDVYVAKVGALLLKL
jgi:hypothetical protein